MTATANQMAWTVAARTDEAGPLRRRVTAYARDHGMAEAPLADLALAVGEAIANAVVHAYRDLPIGVVDVTADVTDGALVVAVCDHGGGLIPRPDSPGLGLGLSMISQLADTFRIRDRDGGGTELHMGFALAGTSPGR
jgi:anti-sigma regulatory factor (Ser/Thr protein kinase)